MSTLRTKAGVQAKETLPTRSELSSAKAAHPAVDRKAIKAPEATPLQVPEAPPTATPDRTGYTDAQALVILTAAMGLWVVGLPLSDQRDLTDFGLVSILTWHFWAALGLVSLGFGLTLLRATSNRWVRAAFPVALIAMLHTTPAIIYGTLRYSWAWKHVGIIDFIQRHGTIDRFADFLPAYHNWPGFFVTAAVIGNLMGATPADIASAVRFTSVILTLMSAAMVAVIVRHFSEDRRTIAVAVWIFVCGNWIGQDYFAPQAVTYFMFLAVIALCLGPLRKPAPKFASGGGIFRWVLRTLLRDDRVAPAAHDPRLAAWSAMLAAALVMCIVATHQLTPVAIIFTLLALAVLGRVSWWLPAFAVCFQVSWVIYFASPFIYTHLIEELTNVGEGVSAASNRLANMAVVSSGQYWVIVAGRALTGALAAAAILGGLRRVFAGYLDISLPALAAAAIALFVNSYGGEILFRVYLFALPAISFFAAALFFVGKTGKNRNSAAALCVAVLGFLAASGFLMANNGKDRQYSFTAEEVEVADWLYSNAPPGSLLIEGSRGYPSQFKNYENFAYIPMSEERQEVRAEFIGDPEAIFGRWMSDPKWKAAFLIITRSQKSYSDLEGIMPFGSLQTIEDRLIASPRFQLLRSSRDAKVFTLTPGVGKMGPWATIPALPATP